MQELNMQEIDEVSGAGVLYEWFSDLRQIAREIPAAFNDLVNSTVDVACTITGDC
jgi:hypothetical protein